MFLHLLDMRKRTSQVMMHDTQKWPDIQQNHNALMTRLMGWHLLQTQIQLKKYGCLKKKSVRRIFSAELTMKDLTRIQRSSRFSCKSRAMSRHPHIITKLIQVIDRVQLLPPRLLMVKHPPQEANICFPMLRMFRRRRFGKIVEVQNYTE